MRMDNEAATVLLRQAAARPDLSPIRLLWEDRITELSRLCDDGTSSTHIAFLGTSLLAKSVDSRVDLFAIKPAHDAGNLRAYSARSLCHSVLVPMSGELAFHLGVTGREPLNNQPYFRMRYLGDGTPVHKGGKAAFDYMVSLVHLIQQLESKADQADALAAFIAVRRNYWPDYGLNGTEANLTPEQLCRCVSAFVRASSDGGKRAQAVVAGIFDVVAGAESVISGRVNDPSRHYPGDVFVRSPTSEIGGKAIEVRDKAVSGSDIMIFTNLCLAKGFSDVCVMMMSPNQGPLDTEGLSHWARVRNARLRLFVGWEQFIEESLFWSNLGARVAASAATTTIEARLIAVEVATEVVEDWRHLIQEAAAA